MLQLDEIQAILDQITYKPGYALRLAVNNGVPYLQVIFEAPDTDTGKVEPQYCRKWQLSFHMVENEIVRTAYMAFEQAEIHECQEFFKYKGAAIYGPHMNPSLLASMVNLLGEGAVQSRQTFVVETPTDAASVKSLENIYGPQGL